MHVHKVRYCNIYIAFWKGEPSGLQTVHAPHILSLQTLITYITYFVASKRIHTLFVCMFTLCYKISPSSWSLNVHVVLQNVPMYYCNWSFKIRCSHIKWKHLPTFADGLCQLSREYLKVYFHHHSLGIIFNMHQQITVLISFYYHSLHFLSGWLLELCDKPTCSWCLSIFLDDPVMSWIKSYFIQRHTKIV
jgi:hypothetical protein